MEGKDPSTLEYINSEELEPGDFVYTRTTGRKFVIVSFGRYSLNCSIDMVCYQNVYPTADAPAGTNWFLETSIFLKQFGK